MNNKPPQLGFVGRFFLVRFNYILLIIFLLIGGVWLRRNYLWARRTGNLPSCIHNLKQIDGAKKQWTLETRASTNDIPKWNDLIGTDAYIKNMPKCPQGGIYHLNRAYQPLTCSLGTTVTPAHVLPQ